MAGATKTSLCDETLTFDGDGELLGYCLDNPDEPNGDDFHTRCAAQCGDKYWVDIDDVGNGVKEGADGSVTDDGDDEGEIEVGYGHYADYCKLPLAARAQLVRGLRMTILEMFRFSDSEWNPSDQIIIECIKRRDHMSAKELHKWLYSQYELTQEYLRDTQKKMERDLANNTEVKIVPAQSGGYIPRKRAVRRLENTSKDQKWCIDHNDGDGNSHRDRGKWSNATKKKCERRNTCRGRNATIRRDAETYFGFAGTGDTLDELEAKVAAKYHEVDFDSGYEDWKELDPYDGCDNLDSDVWVVVDDDDWRPVSRTSHRLLMSGSWDAPMYDMSQFYCDTDGDDYDDESWWSDEHSHNPSGACCMEERVPDPDGYIFADYTGPDNDLDGEPVGGMLDSFFRRMGLRD